ncbi:HAD-IIB family hydrolase [Chloroflexota bacterium]
MPQSYRQIGSALAGRIRLVMTDVDGTITAADNLFSPSAAEAILRLEEHGIITGLVSGRSLFRLESIARDLGMSGPVIAENGGVAKLAPDGKPVELGYDNATSRQALEKLKALFPGAIEEMRDNKYRLVDVGIGSLGVATDELRKHLEGTDADLLDSGFMLHLLPKGISKGKTLMRILGMIQDGELTSEEVMVFGDSTTDISLFQFFSHNVLIINPRLPIEEKQTLEGIAEYISELPFGDGFAQVVSHILSVRRL